MSEYHKIETLYERDEKTFKVKPGVLKNRTYGIIPTWHWTEKIDGTNIRAIWNHETKIVTFGGKTDNAAMPADLVAYLYETIKPEGFLTHFPNSSVVLYGEGYGPGIQKGGGNYAATKKFIMFDVFVVDTNLENTKMGGWWLSQENVEDIGQKLGLKVVPYIGEMDLEEATRVVKAGFPSLLNDGKAQSEGLVGRPAETLFDKKGARLIIKLKTKDFAREI